MENTSDGNPLAEVALALAMGFFSIMVLAMVSMAADGAHQDPGQQAAKLQLARSDGGGEAVTIIDQRIVIFHRGTYLNADLTPFDPRVVSGKPAKSIVLAIDPETTLTASMAARAGLAGRDVTMTVLNQSWMNRLRGVKG